MVEEQSTSNALAAEKASGVGTDLVADHGNRLMRVEIQLHGPFPISRRDLKADLVLQTFRDA